MKKIIFAAVAMTAALFTACDKQNEPLLPVLATDGTRVTITLAEDNETRAFFDTSAKAEVWEKSLSSLSVFAFDHGGTLILRRDFTPEELTARSASMSLPKSTAGTSCSFYAVANLDVTSVRSKDELLALLEKSPANYNATFSEVSTKANRTGGFVMSGSTTQNVGAVNSTTNVGISLKRSVAKVALQTSIDASFAQKYSGSVTISSVRLSKAASQSLVVAGSAPLSGPMTYTHTQIPAVASGKMENLFFLFENGPLSVGNRVQLEIEAIYDLDGNDSTADDRSEVTYSIELAGKAAGEILRNGYYRIMANITGLVGQDCIVSISVADWETPVTQTVTLGA